DDLHGSRLCGGGRPARTAVQRTDPGTHKTVPDTLHGQLNAAPHTKKGEIPMKRLNKTLAGLLAAATSVTMLGGCSAQSGASASAETTGADSDNVLRVAMSADYAPFDWLQEDDSNGAVLTTNGSYMNGYDVLIAK